MTAGEFEHPQPRKAGSVMVQGALILIGAAAIGYFSIWPIVAVKLGYAFTAGHMPRCDAPFTTGLLVRTINRSPAARMYGLEAIEVSRSVAVTDTGDDLACRADIMSNIGRRGVDFTLRFDGAAKDTVLMTVQPWWQ